MEKKVFKFISTFVLICLFVGEFFLYLNYEKNEKKFFKIEGQLVNLDKKIVKIEDSIQNLSPKSIKQTSFKDAFAIMGVKKQLLDIKKEINKLRKSKNNPAHAIQTQKKLWSDLFSTISSSWVKTYANSLSKHGIPKEDKDIAISYYKDMLESIKTIQQQWLSGEFDSKESFEKVREEGAKFYYNLENDLGSSKADKIVKILYPNISFKDYFLKDSNEQ